MGASMHPAARFEDDVWHISSVDHCLNVGADGAGSTGVNAGLGKGRDSLGEKDACEWQWLRKGALDV